MKCEDCLPALTTGGSLHRLLARRHARRCPHCSQVIAQMQRITQELAATPPLTESQRSAWLQVANAEPRVTPSKFWGLRPMLATGLGLAAVAGIVLLLTWRQPTPIEPIEPIGTPVPKEVVQQMESLRSQAQMLAQELTSLEHQADLLDVRRDADALWRQLTRPTSQKDFANGG